MTNFDKFYRSMIGSDLLASSFKSAMDDGLAKYPPYNLIKVGDYDYTLEMAVAGFTEKDIEITTQDGILNVSGFPHAQEAGADVSYIYRGIANRGFNRSWTLLENAQVSGARIENGMLYIDIHVEVPEHRKPKKIELKSKPALTAA